MLKRLKDYFKGDNLEYEFLPPALEIEETPPSPARRVLIWAIFAMLILTFLWSYFGKVDEVAVARGKVIPDGRVKVIQPMETGVIKAIHVEEGQRVKEGQMLIELDPTIKQADVASTAKALSIHVTDKERLMEELNGEKTGNRQEAIGNGRKAKGIFELQNKLKEARESEYKAREDALRLIISQRENALFAAEAILTKLEKTYAILKEQEDAYRNLYKHEYISKMDLLNKQMEFHSAEQELEAQKRIARQAKDSLEEARKNLDALKKEREKGILSDIVDREKSITAIEGEVIKAKKRYELEKLCSPVAGTVHGLASYTVGGVVTPAQPIVTVVPDGTPLIIEAMALNKDIGFLKVGQEAEVKLDTFPFQKYGTIKGKVVFISPDAFEDENLGPVYKVKIKMEGLSLVVDGRNGAVSPGMAVTVEVKTGKRRVIEFFLSPIVKYAKESLTLR
ncbi:MAG: HlyD family type I secretion periplasmic adaptor subunit [Nitrospiraceae bacterium]|nr:HlyD family type I secretion periplasmic adaptor subunit [Nitrospirota bacterium]MDA8340399.1 HlyD family type I secretion periplasmic adaptor subunit [Nitrospiraceae bacterium]